MRNDTCVTVGLAATTLFLVEAVCKNPNNHLEVNGWHVHHMYINIVLLLSLAVHLFMNEVFYYLSCLCLCIVILVAPVRYEGLDGCLLKLASIVGTCFHYLAPLVVHPYYLFVVHLTMILQDISFCFRQCGACRCPFFLPH
jgi:hypothetical protein